VTRALGDDSIPCIRQETLLALPTHQRGIQAAVEPVLPVHGDQLVRGHRPRLALERAGRKASRISTDARRPRNASSSCTTGTPNTAITASPMNFSTEPPCRSTIAFIRSK
jgi:hypothetical protein